MITVAAMLKRLQAVNVENDIHDAIQNTLPDYQDQQQQQLFEGKNSKGEEIGAYRNELYANYKHELNSRPGFGVPDLKLTGNFYRSIQSNVTKDEIETRADGVDYAPKLEQQYGSVIFGLDDDHRGVYVEKAFFPKLKETIEAKTLLTFN